MVDTINNNALFLKDELQWFNLLLDFRLRQYTKQESKYNTIYDITEPVVNESDTAYAQFINNNEFTIDERIVIFLCLIPFIQPQLLDIFFKRNEFHQRGYTEFGGVQGTDHGGFIPTIETALFIIAGDNLSHRFNASLIFYKNHPLIMEGIISMDIKESNDPWLSAPIKLNKEYVDWFTTGIVQKPDLGPDFAAKLLTTEMNWDDVILEPIIQEQILEIKDWIEHGDTLLYEWGLDKKMSKGYRALFHGPSGTGKTLTASVLGKITNRDVYRVDLSLIISKYIGETEKNLANILMRAENKNWILFFDEADALFGKRSSINDSKDRFANQEVSYLLQRIEDFDGIVILASNLKGNIDDAFIRRFQSVVFFQVPNPTLRLQLWQNTFSDKSTLESDINLQQIAKQYELTGGAITNIVRYCSLKAISRGDNIISMKNLQNGIKKELLKEGKTI